MAERDRDLLLQADVADGPEAAFDAFVDDLTAGLAVRGIRLPAAPGESITHGGRRIGDVVAWEPGQRILLSWHSADWLPEASAEILVRFEATSGGTRISVEYRHWRGGLGDMIPEIPGWFAREVAAPVLEATAPGTLGHWILDRKARRPSGAASRSTYRDPTYHRPNFTLLLESLALSAGDYLLEVGCGGGAFLHEALESGCRAAAIDHSGEMVRLASEVNHAAIQAGRLAIVTADAERIPYASGRCSCAVTTGVFGFLARPKEALAEIHRVLARGGRLALFTGTRELVGTPAVPEWAAPRLRFYEDSELRELARAAGFVDVRVDRPDLEPYARQAGLSEDAVAFFRGAGGAQLLTARKA